MRAAGRLTDPAVTPVRIIPVAIAAGIAVMALDRISDRELAPPPPAVSGLPSGSYAATAQAYDAGIAAARERVTARPDEWLVEEQYARALFARGRLTGSYDDYAAAQQALDRAFRDAPPGAGPHLAQANLHLLMHRLGPAERMLDATAVYAVPLDAGDQAEVAGMRGDVAFYRGRYDQAWRLYEEADRLRPGAAAFRKAIYHSKTRRPDLAEQQFDAYQRTLRQPGRQLLANIELQRGILDLDGGKWTDALGHFRRADALFPGWWLVEEHIAETTALLGDRAGAETMYRGIVERTGSPEFMDALAKLLIARGEAAEADRLRHRSRVIWEMRLRQFPEASFGHALDHCVAFHDTACALSLAERNFQARPYGEAGEKLASALLAVGRTDDARRTIDAVLTTPWRTATAMAAAYHVYQAQSDARAEQWRQEALRLDPRIFG